MLTESKHVLYRGSDSPGESLILGHKGRVSTTIGDYETERYGIFLSDNPEFARLYGRVSTYEVNLLKTLRLGQKSPVLWEFIESLDPHGKDRRSWFNAKLNIVQGSWPLWHLFDGDLGRLFTSFLIERNYDSAVFQEWVSNDDDVEVEGTTYVIFDKKSIVHVS